MSKVNTNFDWVHLHKKIHVCAILATFPLRSLGIFFFKAVSGSNF